MKIVLTVVHCPFTVSWIGHMTIALGLLVIVQSVHLFIVLARCRLLSVLCWSIFISLLTICFAPYGSSPWPYSSVIRGYNPQLEDHEFVPAGELEFFPSISSCIQLPIYHCHQFSKANNKYVHLQCTYILLNWDNIPNVVCYIRDGCFLSFLLRFIKNSDSPYKTTTAISNLSQ